MLRTGIELVKSRGVAITEAAEGLSYDTGVMPRWLLQVDDPAIVDCILSCTVYFAGSEDLSATVDVIMDGNCEVQHHRGGCEGC